MSLHAVRTEDDWPRPHQVLSYYEAMRNTLKTLSKSSASALAAALGTSFANTSEDEALESLRRELDCQVVLMLTASFEAVFQIDIRLRLDNRLKDPDSRELRRRFGRRKAERLALEDILDAWQVRTGQAAVFGNFKQLVKLRHWLAHGRHWRQRSGIRSVDPFDAWSRGTAALSAVPILPSLGFVSIPD
jgi:hypothetical protein